MARLERYTNYMSYTWSDFVNCKTQKSTRNIFLVFPENILQTIRFPMEVFCNAQICANIQKVRIIGGWGKFPYKFRKSYKSGALFSTFIRIIVSFAIQSYRENCQKNFSWSIFCVEVFFLQFFFLCFVIRKNEKNKIEGDLSAIVVYFRADMEMWYCCT